MGSLLMVCTVSSTSTQQKPVSGSSVQPEKSIPPVGSTWPSRPSRSRCCGRKPDLLPFRKPDLLPFLSLLRKPTFSPNDPMTIAANMMKEIIGETWNGLDLMKWMKWWGINSTYSHNCSLLECFSGWSTGNWWLPIKCRLLLYSCGIYHSNIPLAPIRHNF